MPKSKSKAGFYAVAKGRNPGVFESWDEAKAQVDGFTGARHKKFSTRIEAEQFIAIHSGTSTILSVPSVDTQPSTSASVKTNRLQPYPRSKPSVKKVIEAVKNAVPSSGRQVWCDGSARGNGQVGSRAGIGIYWDDGDEISERLPGKVQTNNRAELYAIIRVLESDPTPEKPLTILTDSKYSIQCLQDWFPAWQRNGWRTASKKPVENLDLILLCLMLLRGRKKAPKFVHIRGHEGIEGNENADKLANNGAALEEEAEEVLEIRGKTVEGLKAEWEDGDSGVSIQAEETAL